MQNVLSMRNMETAITLLGACPRNEVSFFFALDISRMPRHGARSHEGRLARNVHSEAHMVVFKPLTGAMIFWNERASTFARHTPTSPGTPPPPPFVSTDTPQYSRRPQPPDPHTVHIVAIKGTPLYDIRIVAALLGVFTKFFVAQAWAVRTKRYSVCYKHVKSAVAGHGFTLGGMTVPAQVPAPGLQQELLQSVSLDPRQTDAENFRAQVIQYCTEHDSQEVLHRIHQHYEARAKELNTTEKMSLLNPPLVCPPGPHYVEDTIRGSVLESIVSVVPEEIMKRIGPRATIDFGFSYNPKSEHITPNHTHSSCL